jgi:hypothetical protein
MSGRIRWEGGRYLPDRIVQVELSMHHVAPGGRVGVWLVSFLPDGTSRLLTLEVSHEGLGSRVECIDDHLSVGWASDLNPGSSVESSPICKLTFGPRDRGLEVRKTMRDKIEYALSREGIGAICPVNQRPLPAYDKVLLGKWVGDLPCRDQLRPSFGLREAPCAWH